MQHYFVNCPFIGSACGRTMPFFICHANRFLRVKEDGGQQYVATTKLFHSTAPVN
jgi:hypothetical protein